MVGGVSEKVQELKFKRILNAHTTTCKFRISIDEDRFSRRQSSENLTKFENNRKIRFPITFHMGPTPSQTSVDSFVADMVAITELPRLTYFQDLSFGEQDLGVDSVFSSPGSGVGRSS
ncbi:hypothetical protein SUGI_0874870 [Cryptomeria japonica]|nr:hypothetical protein SUGI_0874870 [Cryptomeria japonica]